MQVTAVGDKHTTHDVIEELIPQEFLILGDLGFGLTSTGGAIIGSGTDATLVKEDADPPPRTTGRQSWRQIR